MAAPSSQSRPEPMNATAYHSKVKVSLYFSDSLYIAGGHVTGKMELECRADKGLSLGFIMVELSGIQELTSRDHSATNTFLYLTRRFQGPSLPPSNAVHPYVLIGSEPLPAHHYPARKGVTTFFFRFPLPESSPSSIDFGKGLAKLRYEVRASVEVGWKGDIRLVTDKKDIDVVEAWSGVGSGFGESFVVGENGKFYAHARILNQYAVAGRSACIELFVRNHSSKKTSSLSLSFTRHLHVPSISLTANLPKSLQISDILLNMSFKGLEYIVQPGMEGSANLVFDIPKKARGVKGGLRDGRDLDETGDDGDARGSDSLFEVKCLIQITIGMGFGSRDIILELPLSILHPAVAPDITSRENLDKNCFPSELNTTYTLAQQTVSPLHSPNYMLPPSNGPKLLPTQAPHLNKPASTSNVIFPTAVPPIFSPTERPDYIHLPPALFTEYVRDQRYYIPSLLNQPRRPSSADPYAFMPSLTLPSLSHPHVLSIPAPDLVEEQFASQISNVQISGNVDSELGKGERASRISTNLRLLSRNRSVSPTSHRFPAQTRNHDFQAELDPNLFEPNYETSQAADQLIATSSEHILSPRPMLSPQHSYEGEIKFDMPNKSPRITTLERLAAAENQDSSQEHMSASEKALPAAPEHTSLGLEQHAYDDSQSANLNTPKLPVKPDLRPFVPAETPLKLDLFGNSGLDELERKLVEQVGTRKFDGERRKIDARGLSPLVVLPIEQQMAIPSNDSAISSLFLPELSLEKVHANADEEADNSKFTQKVSLVNSAKEQNVPIKEQKRHSEAHQLRKAATGRVAAWLGGLHSSEEYSQTDSNWSDDDTIKANRNEQPSTIGAMSQVENEDVVPTTSSGFVLRSSRNINGGINDAKSSPLHTQNNTQLDILNLSTNDDGKGIAAQTDGEKHIPPQPMYDIKSARGGRGGKVTAITAIWTSLSHAESGAVQSPMKKDVTSKKNVGTLFTRGELTAGRAKMIKAPFVPASISSSVAKPTISSTASLARPIVLNHPSTTNLPSISSTTPTDSRLEVASKGNKDFAFGQARLRDLIVKYQEG